jgi:hypothetical protein
MQSFDPQPGLGDIGYDLALREMGAGLKPLVSRSGGHAADSWHLDEIALTDFGHAVLDGAQDWLQSPIPERWVGGVRIVAQQRNWRWDARARGVIEK